jgi:hypothetical protein
MRPREIRTTAGILGILLIGILIGVTVGFAAPDGAPPLTPVGTAFTYQGYITDTGNPANGSYNLAFKIYDDASAGAQVGSTVTKNAVPVSEGYFTVELDFGDWFDGTALWLEIGVQGPGDPGFTVLSPRQPLSPTPYAINADKLDGQHASELGADYQNVIVVAKSGGDYTSVQAAIDSITGAAADNPYLVWVAPGVYSEAVTMKPYVHLQGSGQRATVITSDVTNPSIPPTQATLTLAANVSLRDMTVKNTGTGLHNVGLMALNGATDIQVSDVETQSHGNGGTDSNNYAIYLTGSGTSVTLQSVTAFAENGNLDAVGLYNDSGTKVTLLSGSYMASSAVEHSVGISNLGTLEAEHITVRGEFSPQWNYGIWNQGSGAKITLRGGSVSGRGGTEAIGILNVNGGFLTADGVTALAEDGTDANYALNGEDAGVGTTSVVRGGSFTGIGGDGENYGIRIYGDDSLLDAIGIDTRTAGGELAALIAVAIGDNGLGFISQSDLFGASASVYCDSCMGVRIYNSSLIGGPVIDPGSKVNCFGVYWGNAFWTDTCP